MIFEFPEIRKIRSATRGNRKHFSSPMFYENSRMSIRKESCSLAKMLSLFSAPKHYFTPLSTVEKGTCKQLISASFLGTRTIFIRAVQNCRVNGPLRKIYKHDQSMIDCFRKMSSTFAVTFSTYISVLKYYSPKKSLFNCRLMVSKCPLSA